MALAPAEPMGTSSASSASAMATASLAGRVRLTSIRSLRAGGSGDIRTSKSSSRWYASVRGFNREAWCETVTGSL